MSSTKLNKIQERIDAFERKIRLFEKFNQNGNYFKLSFVPGSKPDTIKLIHPIKYKRSSTHLEKGQGAHTFAFVALLKTLVWLLNDVTLEEAKRRLMHFHSSVYAAYILSLTDCSIDDLKTQADGAHEELSQRWGEETTKSWILHYLTLFLYIHNRLPDAAIAGKSDNRGEGSALKRLQELESILQMHGKIQKSQSNAALQEVQFLLQRYQEKAKKNSGHSKNKFLKLSHLLDLIHSRDPSKEDIIKESAKNIMIMHLSTLIDEEALERALKSNKDVGVGLAGFQVLAVSRILNHLPELNRLLFQGDFASEKYFQNMKASNVFNNLCHDLIKIIFYRIRDVNEISEIRTTHDSFTQRKKHIEDACQWIDLLYNQTAQNPYGTIAYGSF